MLRDKLSVRASEALVRVRRTSKKAKKQATGDPELRANERVLEQALGTKVAIHKNKDGGTMTITFYSREELNALIDRLIKNN
jgi:ParB family chromosome partitioning protein